MNCSLFLGALLSFFVIPTSCASASLCDNFFQPRLAIVAVFGALSCGLSGCANPYPSPEESHRSFVPAYPPYALNPSAPATREPSSTDLHKTFSIWISCQMREQNDRPDESTPTEFDDSLRTAIWRIEPTTQKAQQFDEQRQTLGPEEDANFSPQTIIITQNKTTPQYRYLLITRIDRQSLQVEADSMNHQTLISKHWTGACQATEARLQAPAND